MASVAASLAPTQGTLESLEGSASAIALDTAIAAAPAVAGADIGTKARKAEGLGKRGNGVFRFWTFANSEAEILN